MTKELKVSLVNFYWKTSLFLSIVVMSLLSLYYLITYEYSSLIIIVGFSCFFIPWSFFLTLNELDNCRMQFQKVSIEDEYLLFENLPWQGGAVYAQIAFKNVKSVTTQGPKLNVLFVQRPEWDGQNNDFIIPFGKVPKLQIFSLSWNWKKRRAIIRLLESKGLLINEKQTIKSES